MRGSFHCLDSENDAIHILIVGDQVPSNCCPGVALLTFVHTGTPPHQLFRHCTPPRHVASKDLDFISGFHGEVDYDPGETK